MSTNLFWKLIFKNPNAPRVCSSLLDFQHWDIFHSSCPLYHSVCPAQVSPRLITHCSWNCRPVPRLPAPPADTSMSFWPGWWCSMPVPSSCHACVLLLRSLGGSARAGGIIGKSLGEQKAWIVTVQAYQGKWVIFLPSLMPRSSVRCHFLIAASEIFLHFRLVFLSRWVIHLSRAEADLNIMVQLPNAGFSFRRTSLNRNKCLYVLWDPESNSSRPLWNFSF